MTDTTPGEPPVDIKVRQVQNLSLKPLILPQHILTIQQKSLESLERKRKALFAPQTSDVLPDDTESSAAYTELKKRRDYAGVELPRYLEEKIVAAATKHSVFARKPQSVPLTNSSGPKPPQLLVEAAPQTPQTPQTPQISAPQSSSPQSSSPQSSSPQSSAPPSHPSTSQALTRPAPSTTPKSDPTSAPAIAGTTSLIRRQQHFYSQPKPQWHAPWKLMRVIAGHAGWVRSVCVEPDNQWFATGAGDRTIKIWDTASGQLKLTLTGHIMTVRGLAVSNRHPYMFSCSEDKTVKCWDLERNTAIRDYHGHLSSVYSLDIHPTLDLIVTAGRDAVVRVWDIRSRVAVHVLAGHKSTISQVRCQEADPQVISTSMDSTVRLWDLAAGKTQTVLTHHKKSVRGLTLHPEEFTFATASPDNIKEWKCPEGAFMHNFEPRQDAIVNTLSVNSDGVLFAGGDDGSLGFYDWVSGHKFQQSMTTTMPGSLDSERGIFASCFDKSGLRLITTEADKTIKMWREDPEATPETHPGLEWKPKQLRIL